MKGDIRPVIVKVESDEDYQNRIRKTEILCLEIAIKDISKGIDSLRHGIDMFTNAIDYSKLEAELESLKSKLKSLKPSDYEIIFLRLCIM